MRVVRIGGGGGAWGDDVTAPARLMTDERLDYLVLDYLAEITLAIMQRHRAADPERGYATDFAAVVEDVLPTALDSATRIVTNAGGLNPDACAEQVLDTARRVAPSRPVVVAVVYGDDLMPQLTRLAGEVGFGNSDDHRSFSEIHDRVVSANVYLGAQPIREALVGGADVVICGRVTDASLTLGPLLYEHGWSGSDWDKLAAGTVAGHLLECACQATGGNYHDWVSVPGLEDVGYPIAEVSPDGSITLTKPVGSGGMVTAETVTEQLLHEIDDPRAVRSPDVTVDWTSLQLTEHGNDRVTIDGATGAAPPTTLKVSMTYRDGYRTVLMWPYAWPKAYEKARSALRRIQYQAGRMGLEVECSRADVFGSGAIHGDRMQPNVDAPEVFARFAARGPTKRDMKRLAAMQGAMIYGPPGLAGHIAGGRGRVEEILTHWPTTIPRQLVEPRVEHLSTQSPSTRPRSMGRRVDDDEKRSHG